MVELFHNKKGKKILLMIMESKETLWVLQAPFLGWWPGGWVGARATEREVP